MSRADRIRVVSFAVAAAALIAVLLPVGARAGHGGAAVHIQDSNSSKRAQVTGGGQLSTSLCDPGAAPSPARCADIAAGRLKIHDGGGSLTVDGVVLNVPINDGNGTLSSFVGLSDSTTSGGLSGPDAAKTQYFITSLTFANTGTTDLQARVRVLSGPTPCSAGSVEHETTWVSVPAGQTVHAAYPTPIETGTPSGSGLTCLRASLVGTPGAGSEMKVSVTGWLL